MQKLCRFDVMENIRVARDTYSMALFGDCGELTRPGQFVNIALPGKYLRRPFSVCRVSGGLLTLVYKVMGEGTRQMSEMTPGQNLELLTGLGNGFDLSVSGENPLLIGGGLGAAPLFWLAEQLLEKDVQPTVILGFNTRDEIFLVSQLSALGARVYVSTADGSVGVRGLVTDVMKTLSLKYSYLYTCGPEPMMKAVCDLADCDGQYSFEKHMACGFGACMCCSCETKYGAKRICRDGPVLTREEIIW